MFLIKLKDNDYKGSPLKIFSNNEFIDFQSLSDNNKSIIRKALSSVCGISLRELKEKGIFVYPTESVEEELKEDQIICSVQNLESDFPIIKTSNIMGFFSPGGEVQIEITSRFEDDEKHFFLHYMLQKVCNIAVSMELTHVNNNPFYEFLIYLFPMYLKRAVNQGLFRNYIVHHYNDSNVRGTIDFPQHIMNNIPFNGKIAYKTQEYTQENFLNHLIRHTIEFIAANKKVSGILVYDDSTKAAVQMIRGCTKTYNRSSREFIINKNYKQVSHPYYTEYESLRKLCILILMHNRISYGEAQHNQFNGIIFNGASLWEEYLNIIIQEYIEKNKSSFDFEHPNNRTKEGKKYLFEKKSGIIYPDFLVIDKSSRDINAVLDAKYKYLEKGNVENADYFQILSYMFRFNCKRGVLIYPSYKSEKSFNLYKQFLEEHESRVSCEIAGLSIPYPANTEEVSYKSFCEEMKKNEESLLKEIL